mmetsp:Transcript_46556/g.106133  ORF Transcript_46556/g.106133 Transcript_46556/m.106133 type:complete len:225 (-) Transcript_46556:581-1255(-)
MLRHDPQRNADVDVVPLRQPRLRLHPAHVHRAAALCEPCRDVLHRHPLGRMRDSFNGLLQQLWVPRTERIHQRRTQHRRPSPQVRNRLHDQSRLESGEARREMHGALQEGIDDFAGRVDAEEPRELQEVRHVLGLEGGGHLGSARQDEAHQRGFLLPHPRREARWSEQVVRRSKCNSQMDEIHVLDVPLQPAELRSTPALLETRGKLPPAHRRRVDSRGPGWRV